MFLAVGVGGFTAGIFHLTTHAFFKALLFLAAGVVIHALHGEEDLRRWAACAAALPSSGLRSASARWRIAGIPLFVRLLLEGRDHLAAFDSARRQRRPRADLALITVGPDRLLHLPRRSSWPSTAGEVERPRAGRQPPAPRAPPAAGDPRARAAAASPPARGRPDHDRADGDPRRAVAGRQPHHAGHRRLPGAGLHRVPSGAEPRWRAGLLARSWPSRSLLAVAGIGLAYLCYVRQPKLPAQLGRALPAESTTFLLNRWYVDDLYDRVVRPADADDRRAVSAAASTPRSSTGWSTASAGSPCATAARAARRSRPAIVRNYALAILGGTLLVLIFVLVEMGR